MIDNPTVIFEINIDRGIKDLTGIFDHNQAFIVFRYKGTVVGQIWLPVIQNMISAKEQYNFISTMAWPIWQQAVEENHRYKSMEATIIVCTKDRTEDLAQCLIELLRLVEYGHEVIIVDNRPSNDETKRLVAGFPEIRYVLEQNPGAGFARNRGLLEATKEVIAFTDDDARVDSGWLDALLRNFNDPMVAIVTGITMPLELENSAQVWFESTHGFARGFSRKVFDSTNVSVLAAGLVGASVNMAVRRSALSEIGLFDPALGPGTIALCGEDHEFFYKTLACGYRIVYEPAALVWHRHRRSWVELRNTLYAYGVGVYAWWTKVLFSEKELSLLKIGIEWFYSHYFKNLVRSLLNRPGCLPLDLAYAEFKGALMGPYCYIKSKHNVSKFLRSTHKQSEPLNGKHSTNAESKLSYPGKPRGVTQ